MLSAVADVLGFHGDLVPGIVDAGRRFAASVVPDMEEIERRRSAKEAAVLDRYLLAALFELPEGEWIARDGLDPVIQAVLDSVPGSAVVHEQERIKRVWRPAVRVMGVIIEAAGWRRGLERAGRFAPDAHRAYVLPQSQVARSAIVESRRFGVGVVLAPSGGRPQVVVAPSAQVRGRPSPRHWKFLESAYEAWAGASPTRSAQAGR